MVRWRIVDGTALRFHSWGSETAVFNPLSGDTHLVESLAAKILISLQEEPLALGPLSGAISEKQRFDFKLVTQEVQAVLTDMQALLLVEPIRF